MHVTKCRMSASIFSVWYISSLPWVTEIKYLGIHIVNFKSFRITTEQSGAISLAPPTRFLAE